MKQCCTFTSHCLDDLKVVILCTHRRAALYSSDKTHCFPARCQSFVLRLVSPNHVHVADVVESPLSRQTSVRECWTQLPSQGTKSFFFVIRVSNLSLPAHQCHQYLRNHFAKENEKHVKNPGSQIIRIEFVIVPPDRNPYAVMEPF